VARWKPGTRQAGILAAKRWIRRAQPQIPVPGKVQKLPIALAQIATAHVPIAGLQPEEVAGISSPQPISPSLASASGQTQRIAVQASLAAAAIVYAAASAIWKFEEIAISDDEALQIASYGAWRRSALAFASQAFPIARQ